MSAELVRLPNQAESMIAYAVQHRAMLVEFTRQVMVAGVDYGTIPGTKENTLLKPGAEKLCNLFQFVPRFTILTQVEDWTGADHAGEPFFYYLIRCSLFKAGELVVEADGSINSWEKKYRYRKSERVCPDCGAAAIMRSKYEDAGWYCFNKKGGCGAKFVTTDTRITEQETGQTTNTDIFDQVNSLLKMAEKRAVIAAVLLGANASEFFTQDLENIHTPEPAAQYVNTETGEVTEQSAQEAQDNRPLKDRLAERLRECGAEKDDLSRIVRRMAGRPDDAPCGKILFAWAVEQPGSAWELIAEAIRQEEHLRSENISQEQPEASEETDDFAEPGGTLLDATGKPIEENVTDENN